MCTFWGPVWYLSHGLHYTLLLKAFGILFGFISIHEVLGERPGLHNSSMGSSQAPSSLWSPCNSSCWYSAQKAVVQPAFAVISAAKANRQPRPLLFPLLCECPSRTGVPLQRRSDRKELEDFPILSVYRAPSSDQGEPFSWSCLLHSFMILLPWFCVGKYGWKKKTLEHSLPY